MGVQGQFAEAVIQDLEVQRDIGGLPNAHGVRGGGELPVGNGLVGVLGIFLLLLEVHGPRKGGLSISPQELWTDVPDNHFSIAGDRDHSGGWGDFSIGDNSPGYKKKTTG